MLLIRLVNWNRKLPRGFAVLSITAVISMIVGLSGLGFAADPPKPVEGPKRDEPKKAPATPTEEDIAALKKKLKQFEDQSRPVLRLSEKQMMELLKMFGEDNEDFKKQIQQLEKASKDGKADDMAVLIQELQKANTRAKHA